MSMTGDTGTDAGHAIVARLRGTFENIIAGLALLRRTPRAAFALRGGMFTLSVLTAGAVIVLAAAIWQMFLFDAAMAAGARLVPRWIGFLFHTITDFGKSGWFLWPIGIVLIAMAVIGALALTRVNRLVLAALAARLMFIFLAIGIPGLFVTIVKRLIGRARPSLTGPPFDPFSYSPFSWNPAFASIPSGHATTAFAAAIAIGALWPKTRWIMWSYAIVIAVSRVIVSAHYPSDVLVGAAVGMLGALLVRNYFAARGLAFAVASGGEIHAMPGPSFARVKRVVRAAAGK
ncbi:MAG: phosphatase PAP2 family protein [Rhizobiales bacterium]|nr:phosphatase PAP2 family protein [Hyphomicrobiales bacterium]